MALKIHEFKYINPAQRVLMGPGPVEVPPRVLQAMSAPCVGHLDPYFLQVMDETQRQLRFLFQTENGLTIPDLPPDLIARIDRILPPYWSRSNPVDLVGEVGPQIPLQIVEELIQWEGCDAVIHLGIVGRLSLLKPMIRSTHEVDPTMDRKFLDSVPKALLEFETQYTIPTVRLMEKYGKPILGVNLLPDENARTILEVEGSPYKGVSFLTPERPCVWGLRAFRASGKAPSSNASAPAWSAAAGGSPYWRWIPAAGEAAAA